MTKRKRAIRNPFYEDIRRNGIVIDVEPSDATTRSRPRRRKLPQRTSVRSVRLPVDLWKLVQAQARRERISINAALRQAARIWIRS